jgi:hypothetical protein
MSSLLEYREAQRQDAAARALTAATIRQEGLDRAAARRRDEREAAANAAAHRRYGRRAQRAARLAALPNLGMSALWATIIVLPIAIAWTAQAQFAATALHMPVPLNHGFPAAVEVAAWICAFEAHRRIRRGLSAGSLPRWMWALASIAAVINVSHGIADGWAAGLALGAMSLLGVLLHSIRQGLDAAAATGRNTGITLWRRIRYPRLSLAALSLRAARELPVGDAWVLAWVDRFGVGPDAPRHERKLARVIVRRNAKSDREAAKTGEITIIGGRVQPGFAVDVQEYIDAERAAALAEADAATAHAHSVVQGAQDALNAAAMVFGPDALNPQVHRPELGKLSQRATELYPALVAAHIAGELPSTSVKGLREWVRINRDEPLGVPTAMELRDALTSLRAVDDETEAFAS